MRIVQSFFSALWKLWYYLLNFLSISLLSPLLFFLLVKDSYRCYYKLARLWGWLVFHGLGFRLRRTGCKRLAARNYMVVCNHGSEMDIMIALRLIEQPLVFVGKKELARIPIFGFLYRRASILVDRDSLRSRSAVYDQVSEKLEQGRSVFMAPEGGIPPEGVRLGNFKDGAFTLAIRHQLPILPITIANARQCFPYDFFKGHPGIIYAHVHPPIETKGYTLKQRAALRDKTRALIQTQLDHFYQTLPPKAFQS